MPSIPLEFFAALFITPVLYFFTVRYPLVVSFITAGALIAP